MKRYITYLVAISLFAPIAQAQAAETAPTRDQIIATYHAQWDARWKALYARILITEKKATLDSSVKKMYDKTLEEYLGADKTIKDNLASQTTDLTGLNAYVEEEYDEYTSYIYQVEKSISKYKSITCVKGTKKKVVTNLKPKCPSGYKKK